MSLQQHQVKALKDFGGRYKNTQKGHARNKIRPTSTSQETRHKKPFADSLHQPEELLYGGTAALAWILTGLIADFWPRMIIVSEGMLQLNGMVREGMANTIEGHAYSLDVIVIIDLDSNYTSMVQFRAS